MNPSLAQYLPLLSAPELVMLAAGWGGEMPTWLARRVEKAKQEIAMLTEECKKLIREKIAAEWGWAAPSVPKPSAQRDDLNRQKVAAQIEHHRAVPAPQALGRAKAIIDSDGNRYGSLGEAVRRMNRSSSASILSNAIRRKSLYRGRRWWFLADAPADVLKQKQGKAA